MQRKSVKSRISVPTSKVSGNMDARSVLNKKKNINTVTKKKGIIITKTGGLVTGVKTNKSNPTNLLTLKLDARHKLAKKVDARQKLQTIQKSKQPVIQTTQKITLKKKINLANGKGITSPTKIQGKGGKTAFKSGTLTRTVAAGRKPKAQLTRKAAIPGNPNIFTIKNDGNASNRRRRGRSDTFDRSGFNQVQRQVQHVQNFPAFIDDSATRMFYDNVGYSKAAPLPPLMDITPLRNESLRLQNHLKYLKDEEERAERVRLNDLYEQELETTRTFRKKILEMEERKRQRDNAMMEEIVIRPSPTSMRSQVFKPSASSYSVNSLIVSNLIPVIHESELESCFEQFGKVSSIEFVSTDSAKVTFEQEEDALMAEKYLDNKTVPVVFGDVYMGTKYGNQRIKVRLAQNSDKNNIKAYFTGKPQRITSGGGLQLSSGPLRFQSSNSASSGGFGRPVEKITPDIQATHSALFSNSRNVYTSSSRGFPRGGRGQRRFNVRRF